MKIVKITAICLLVLIACCVLNTMFGFLPGPGDPGWNAMKVKIKYKPWRAERGADPARLRKGRPEELTAVLSAMDDVKSTGSAPVGMGEILARFRAACGEEVKTDPWYLAYDILASRMAGDAEGFRNRLSILEMNGNASGDLLAMLGGRLDKLGFHRDAWTVYRMSFIRFLMQGDSLDDSAVFIFNQLFYPLTAIKSIAGEEREQIIMERVNGLVKLNPRIEGMYWIYRQISRFFEDHGKPSAARAFSHLSRHLFHQPSLFSPAGMFRADYLLNGAALAALFLLVFLAALRFKYRRPARRARQRLKRIPSAGTFSLAAPVRSPYYYLAAREYAFIILLFVVFSVLTVNLFMEISTIGRGASLPLGMALGRFTAPDARAVLERLETHYGDQLPFKRFQAYALGLNERLEKGREVLESILAEDPDDVQALVNLAVVEHRTGNSGRAAELITSALKRAPECLEAVHNARIITGEKHPLPAWFDELARSTDPAVTARIVDEHFDTVWPGAMVSLLNERTETMFMSDRNRFLNSWVNVWKSPGRTARAFMEISGLLSSGSLLGKNVLFNNGKLSNAFLVRLGLGLLLAFIAVIAWTAANDPDRDRELSKSSATGEDETGKDIYGDESFLETASAAETAAGAPLRKFPFIGNFAAGQIITGTASLGVFLYCLAMLVFTHTAWWGMQGAPGLLSSIAIPSIKVLSGPMVVSPHDAALRTIILAAGLVLSLIVSLWKSSRLPGQGTV